MALRPGICTAFTFKIWDTLKTGGVTTVVDFISRNPEELSQDLQLPYKDICSIRRVLLAEHSPLMVTGSKLYEAALSKLAILPTGFVNFDQLLDGGLYTGELTEIAGDSTTGKTRVSLRCIASTVTTGDQRAYFIDTSGSFDSQSLVEAVVSSTKEGQPMTESQLKPLLENVTCVETWDLYGLLNALGSLQRLLTQQSSEMANLKMIVIDNFSSVINPLIGGDIVYRQGMLTQLGMQLKQLALNHCISVVVTNNMIASFKGDKAKAALGKTWSHMTHTRVILTRPEDKSVAEKGIRVAELVKSGRQGTPASCSLSLDYFTTQPD